jgi:hypothetical protein
MPEIFRHVSYMGVLILIKMISDKTLIPSTRTSKLIKIANCFCANTKQILQGLYFCLPSFLFLKSKIADCALH